MVEDHFEQILDMVSIGSGAQRQVEDWKLSRYACYLVIQNADPSKPLVALGQTYFAVQTRRQELADDAALKEDRTRLLLRAEIKKHNKFLAGVALTFHFTFNAPATKTPAELERFLKIVEKEAKRLGFNTTLVLNAAFDNEERRGFARLLTTGERIESERLKGVVLIQEGQVFTHDCAHGECRLIPEHGVVLVVTNEHKQEIVFGFLQYPGTLKDTHGRRILDTNAGGDWRFTDFVVSPEPPYSGQRRGGAPVARKERGGQDGCFQSADCPRLHGGS